MILIGEKLNGSIPSVGAAVRSRDEAFLKERALTQAAAGADYLDVCAGVPGEAEAETLLWMARLVENTVDLPLCVDSPNPAAIAAVLPQCRRAGLVNSVSLERGKIETIFPLIAGTEWKCVALLCSDEGVPDSVEARLELFERILAKADAYGIAHERLFIDPIVHTLSTDGAALTTFAACTREIRRRSERVHIVSGLSNISFGLPARTLVNHAFLVLALQAGMDSAILDVTDRELTGLAFASEALLGHDEYCLDYISAFRSRRIGPAGR